MVCELKMPQAHWLYVPILSTSTGQTMASLNWHKNADLLIHDGQYTEEEYKKFKGWGHSTWKQAIDVAIRANVKKLIITHHDPDHDDDFLDRMEEMSKREFPNCEFAKEGMEVMV